MTATGSCFTKFISFIVEILFLFWLDSLCYRLTFWDKRKVNRGAMLALSCSPMLAAQADGDSWLTYIVRVLLQSAKRSQDEESRGQRLKSVALRCRCAALVWMQTLSTTPDSGTGMSAGDSLFLRDRRIYRPYQHQLCICAFKHLSWFQRNSLILLTTSVLIMCSSNTFELILFGWCGNFRWRLVDN